jgi:hypothetical protein
MIMITFEKPAVLAGSIKVQDLIDGLCERLLMLARSSAGDRSG